MTSTDLASEHAERVAHQLDDVQPGVITTPEVTAAIGRLFEHESWLTAEQYLLTPFGFPPVPRPQPARPDGTGRIPSTVKPIFAGHPVWWLDTDTARQRAGEPDDVYAIRLYLEVVARGWWDPVDGQWFDFLHGYAGLDIEEDPDAADRVAAYLDGHPDPLLCRLVLDPPAHAGPSDAGERAVELVNSLREILADYQADADAEVAAGVAEARRVLADTDVDEVMARLLGCLRGIRHHAQLSQDINPFWPEVAQAASAVASHVEDLYTAIASVALPVCARETDSDRALFGAVDTLLAHAEQLAEHRGVELHRLLETVRLHPLADDGFNALVGTLRGWLAEGLQRLQRSLAYLDGTITTLADTAAEPAVVAPAPVPPTSNDPAARFGIDLGALNDL